MSDTFTQGGIMVVGAHAGDAENMAGAVVLKHTRAGQPATVVHMTLGEAGHPTLSSEVYAEQRKREVQESARLMGATAIWLPYRDGELPVNDEAKFRLCDLIRQHRPAVILTHWRGSIHKDHVATHQIVQDAIFYAGLPAIRRELPAHSVSGLYYAENWEDMEGFQPNVYLDVTDVWDSFLDVLRSHALMRGGVSSFRYLDYYNALGTVRGCLSGFGKAVALMSAWAGTQRLGYLPGLGPSR
jgi:LmbE family N-acetylglucosaminyl deacetylase